MRKIPELLAPAGSFEKMVVAIHYGADAVYCGTDSYSLRAHAGNFTIDQLAEAVSYAHGRAVKLYVAVNIFAREGDFAELDPYLLALAEMGVDGLIISDPGVLVRARELVPRLRVHLSTQANVTNSRSARFWNQQGAARLNLARELSIAEIRAIAERLADEKNLLELEMFVHGALCISWSGRCLLSRYLTGRDANQGDCAQPCRYSYALVEEKRPGQYFPIKEDSRGSYIMNSKDLCLLRRLPELCGINNVNSLKIEGRMKSVFYVGGVVRVYRAALDYIAAARAAGESLARIRLPEDFFIEIEKIGTRGHTENFADGAPAAGGMLYQGPRLAQGMEPAGIVLARESDKKLRVGVRNQLAAGEKLKYLGPGLESETLTINRLVSESGDMVDQAHPGTRVILETARPFSALVAKNGLLTKT
ncbi:MAG: U32 family peptidase [Desulfobacterales bacterium]|nr:U32 family peptidase [Desulfobacterales bacterium]